MIHFAHFVIRYPEGSNYDHVSASHHLHVVALSIFQARLFGYHGKE